MEDYRSEFKAAFVLGRINSDPADPKFGEFTVFMRQILKNETISPDELYGALTLTLSDGARLAGFALPALSKFSIGEGLRVAAMAARLAAQSA